MDDQQAAINEHNKMACGFASAVSPLVPDLWRDDTREVPPALTTPGNHFPEAIPISFKRYYDPAFAELEKEHLWKKQWQYACNEEDIPEVGDRIPYTVGRLSFMIVRSGPSEFRAFHNSCLHRGTKLCEGQSSGETVRCPFHAWEWNLDGSLHNIPSRWDFQQVNSDDYRLPEIQVATWDGFIFVNPDPAAPPFAETLGVLPDHFASRPYRERYTAIHVQKKVRANWKVAMEAFMEAYHVIETHTDSMSFTGDASTQYDIWDDGKSHVSRLITPLVVPSPHLGDNASLQAAADDAFRIFAMGMPGIPVPSFDPSSSLSGRAQVAQWRREVLGAALSIDMSAWSDASMIDSIQYFMFPNFFPWYGEGLPLIYRFLPHGDDPNESVMTVRLTVPVPGNGAPRPPSAPILELDFDEPFNGAPELGLLAKIFDQDMSNLPIVQTGLHAAADTRAQATLGRYQEQRIRHFHEVLNKKLGL